jgi:hypothetical protein
MIYRFFEFEINPKNGQHISGKHSVSVSMDYDNSNQFLFFWRNTGKY